ncbi:monooxygenase [Cryptotrichosporon argae]
MTIAPLVRVAVIGAGVAGLTHLKQLTDANYDRSPKPFLRAHSSDGSGQTWLYPPAGENPTPVYDGLRANLPKDLMSLRGFPFADDVPLFAKSDHIHSYLRDYAAAHDLLRHIRFETRVERLHRAPGSARRWTIESSGPAGRRIDEFDFVSVANGHYSDAWIPAWPGFQNYTGQVVHSREYRRPEEYAGKTVLVVGGYASAGDIARQLASLNIGHYEPTGVRVSDSPLPFTRIYQSMSGAPNAQSTDDDTEAWKAYVYVLPLVDRFDGDVFHFQNDPFTHEPVGGFDVVIFATGYNNSLPFCRRADAPWASRSVLAETIRLEERAGGDEWEVGGTKGLLMQGMDELLLFLAGDRTIAFPGLRECFRLAKLIAAFQVVPFPFTEVQARLVAYLWAGLLPSFPEHPSPPPNTTNPITAPAQVSAPPVRRVFATRREYVFPNPYEFKWCEYVFSLLAEAYEGRDVEDHWKAIEDWRRARRADTGLRKRTLGY